MYWNGPPQYQGIFFAAVALQNAHFIRCLSREPISDAWCTWYVCAASWSNKSWYIISISNGLSLNVVVGFQNFMVLFNPYFGPAISGYPPMMQFPSNEILNTPNHVGSGAENPLNVKAAAEFERRGQDFTSGPGQTSPSQEQEQVPNIRNAEKASEGVYKVF